MFLLLPHVIRPWEETKNLLWKRSSKLNVYTENMNTIPHFLEPLFPLGKVMKLSPKAEEVATFFAKMLDHEYTTKEIFRKNFFKDWRKVL